MVDKTTFDLAMVVDTSVESGADSYMTAFSEAFNNTNGLMPVHWKTLILPSSNVNGASIALLRRKTTDPFHDFRAKHTARYPSPGTNLTSPRHM